MLLRCAREETELLKADELASQGFLIDRAAVAVFECRHALNPGIARSMFSNSQEMGLLLHQQNLFWA